MKLERQGVGLCLVTCCGNVLVVFCRTNKAGCDEDSRKVFSSRHLCKDVGLFADGLWDDVLPNVLDDTMTKSGVLRA